MPGTRYAGRSGCPLPVALTTAVLVVVLAQARDVAQEEQRKRAEAEEMLNLIGALEDYEKTGNPEQGEYRFVER